MFRKIICWVRAIPLWLRCGEFVPHVYTQEYEKANIIATDHSFRVSEGLQHTADETVYQNACLIRSRCKYCGHEDLSWYHSWEERWKIQ